MNERRTSRKAATKLKQGVPDLSYYWFLLTFMIYAVGVIIVGVLLIISERL